MILEAAEEGSSGGDFFAVPCTLPEEEAEANLPVCVCEYGAELKDTFRDEFLKDTGVGAAVPSEESTATKINYAQYSQ